MAADYKLCDRIGNNLSELGKWSVWQNILLGQFLSLLLCVMNILSYYINLGSAVILPTGQSFPHYMVLCTFYTTWLALRSGDKGLISIIKARGWRYLLLALIEVQANTLMSTAHKFTVLTSIQLLGCVGIPVALALSCLVLGVRYRMVHIIGVSVCLMGVGCIVWANIEDTKIDGRNQLVGDMLSLGGTILFAMVTVLQELSVKTTDVVEYLGLLGFFGSIISGLQMILLEKQSLLTSSWKTSTVILSAFSVCQFLFCTFSSLFLLSMGTTALNLSFLSGNFYTHVVGLLLLNFKFHALYFLSYFLTMTGLYIYAIKRTPSAPQYTSSGQSQEQTNFNRSECQLQEHIISSQSTENSGEMLTTFGNLNSTETFPISLSTNTTFTSFYGSQDFLNTKTTTSSA